MPAVLVVAAALVLDRRVLAGRRRASGWEFPGGKVEPGETAADALVRECREELSIEVTALREIAAAGERSLDLRLWLARLVAGTPIAGPDHEQLRWVGAAELDDLDWLPIDRALLDAIRQLL